MKKEGLGDFINSRDGRVSLSLLFSIFLIFILTITFSEAVIIKQITPSNNTFNASGNSSGTFSRNINFTFNVTWAGDAADVIGNSTNCSLWINSTTNGLGWQRVRNASGNDTADPNARIVNGSNPNINGISYMNYTFNADGNFTYSIGCLTNASPVEGAINFSANLSNFTVVIDTTPPRIVGVVPNASVVVGAVWQISNLNGSTANLTATTGNFTGWPITFYVNISDNNTLRVWYILNSTLSNTPTQIDATSVGYLENSSGAFKNVTMVRDLAGTVGATEVFNSIMDRYHINVSLNLSSPWRGPGAHSVKFCATDKANNTACSGLYDFVVIGLNVTDMENSLSSFGQTGGISLNITWGNGTEIVRGDNDSSGGPAAESFINPLVNNFTFIFNFSKNSLNVYKIYIVGLTVDEVLLGNVSNTNITTTPETGVFDAVGRGFNITMLGADLRKSIPDFVRYKFGVLELAGVGYDRRMYCTGTDLGSSPNCTRIRTCNATAFGVNNDTDVLTTILSPTSGEASACFLEGDKGQLNGVSLTTGKTYIFVKHFSQGTVGNDTGAPEVQFFGQLANNEGGRTRKETPINNVAIFNTSGTTILINFTVADLNSSGINMSRENVINVTFAAKGEGLAAASTKFYVNNKNLTCLPNGSITNTSVFNITGFDNNGNLTDGVNCTLTLTGLSNGTYNITVMARDTSNNSNLNTTSVLVTVDNIPPRIHYFNITNASVFNTSDTANEANAIQLGADAPANVPNTGDGTTAQGRTIYAFANWTDNLTFAVIGLFQFYNQSANSGAGGWQTLNTTPANQRLSNQSGWSNFSFPIPTGRHKEFEGRNVSFRVIANDTLGNINSSDSRNLTIQINDTFFDPTIIINGTLVVNGTNITDTTPRISWNITSSNELDVLRSINVSVDGTTAAGKGVDPTCNKYAFYDDTSASDAIDVQKNRNRSFQISSDADAACPLGNGTHYVRIIVMDTWRNTKVAFHNFTVNTAEGGPNITLNSTQNNATFFTINQTNLTPFVGIMFAAADLGQSRIKNLSFTSSCNSTEQAFPNATFIWPFNYSQCKGAEANQTVNVTAFDFAGNSQTKTFGFLVDDVGPSLAVNAPTNGFRGGNNITINLSAKDGTQKIASFGYFLDTTGIAEGAFVRLNADNGSLGNAAVNATFIFSANFTTGTHTIKFASNDTLGNVRNSSVLTFTVDGPIDFTSIGLNMSANTTANATALQKYNTNISKVNLTNSSGATIETSINVTDQTLTLFMALNSTTKGVNVSFVFNGSSANWDKVSNFTIKQNDTTIMNHITNNFTAVILDFVLINENISKFLPNNNSYYGIVKYPVNASNATIGGQIEVWYFKNNDNLTAKTNVTECSAGFNPSFTFGVSSACWNNTNNQSINIYVPHFSGVAVVNNSGIPFVNVTTPAPPATWPNQSVSMFEPNITVASDAVSCVYSINSSQPNKTMVISESTCVGQTERFKVLAGPEGPYNITFTVNDSEGNVNNYFWRFNITDSTSPTNPNSSRVSVSVSTTTASITISDINETVNASVKAAPNSSITTSEETDFNKTQVVSLTGLTANTKYHFNVTVCDFNGNCAVNGTDLSFTTSAAAAAAAAAAASSGGGGGGAAAPSNVVASAGRQWDALSAGSSGVLTINNEKIAVTGVVIDVKNAVSNPSITVESLASNPYTAAAAAKVYQYLQLKRGNIADTDTSKITINFKVAKSWLASSGVAEDNVVLYRYSDNKWNMLPTTKTGSDANNLLYQSATPGFSAFAIGTKEAPPTEAPATPTPTEAPAAPTGAVPTEAPTAPTPTGAPTAAAPKKEGLSKTALAWIIVIIIVVISAAGYYLWQRKKESY